MDKEVFKKDFRTTLEYMFDIMVKKNSDYSGWDSCSNPFKNFQLVEQLGVSSVEQGFLVRMCDKMSRITSLIDNEAKVSDESICDTLTDLANYAIIMSLYVKSKKTTRDNTESVRWNDWYITGTTWF